MAETESTSAQARAGRVAPSARWSGLRSPSLWAGGGGLGGAGVHCGVGEPVLTGAHLDII